MTPTRVEQNDSLYASTRVTDMPFKSRSQLRKFGAMAGRGEISKASFKEWRDATPSVKKLPERVRPKKKNRKRKGKRSATAEALRNYMARHP